MEKIINDIVEILKKLANKIVVDEYLEEISRFDYNILTKKDKKIKERKLRAFYFNKLKELGLNPIFGYAKTKVNGMRYTRYVEAV